ncbi:MAG: hypothetical protein ACPG5B_16675 [Chitinophagales bacterium]
MKKFIHIFIVALFFICSTGTTFANSNHNVSTLYLKVFNGKAFTLTFDKSTFEANQVHILEGIQPNRYLLKVTQRFTEEELNEHTKGYEKLLYYGHIRIAPKSVIFAYIDAKGDFKVYSQRPTITVFYDCKKSKSTVSNKKSKAKKDKKNIYNKELFFETKRFYC